MNGRYHACNGLRVRGDQAYREIGFEGPMRPDHAPTMEGEENVDPGYMVMGRLFAVGYMRGLIDAVWSEPA